MKYNANENSWHGPFFLLMAFWNHSSLPPPLSVPLPPPFFARYLLPFQLPRSLSPLYWGFYIRKIAELAVLQLSHPGRSLIQLVGRPQKPLATYCSIFTIWHFVNGGGKSIQPVQDVHNKWWVTAAWFMAVLLRELPYSCSMETLSPFPLLLLFLSFSILPLFLLMPLKEQTSAGDNLCDSHSGDRSVPTEPDQSWNTQINLI